MAQQTAIEWLENKFNNHKPYEFLTIQNIKKWIIEAKQMEYEQRKEYERNLQNELEKRNRMSNFKLISKAGTYEADTFFNLVISVLKHRFWHLRTHGKWMD
jgi:hypothetical protein